MPASALPPEPLVVLHCCERWLPLTEAWLFEQVRSLPPEIACHVACGSLENMDQFRVANIHARTDVAPAVRFAHGLLRRVGRPQAFEVSVARRQRARVIHSHFGHVGCANLATARRVHARHLVSFYGFDVGYLPQISASWRQRYRELFTEVDGVFCEGPHMAQRIVELGCPQAKIHVHHLGVDLDALPYKPRHWRPGETLRVLIAASFTEKKGIPYAVDALARIAREVNLAVTVIGDAPPSEAAQAEKARIIEAIRRGGIEKECQLLGYKPYDELRRQAYSHHVFLSPSVTASSGDSEGGAPMTIPAMAATGMPIVSTRHCDIPHVVIDNVTGLLADERDVNGLVRQLRSLISRPDDWEPMLKAARQRIETEFNTRIQATRLAQVYRSVCRDGVLA